MKIRIVSCTLLGVAACWSATCLSAEPVYAYLTTIQLANGRTVQCAVNKPLPHAYASGAPLSRREQTEAEVLATQRLRLFSGPASDYPTPYTAPDIACASVG